MASLAWNRLRVKGLPLGAPSKNWLLISRLCPHNLSTITPYPCPLLFRRYPQRFHFPVKMAALQAEDLGGAAYVAVVLVKRFKDVIALVGVAGLVQGGEFGLGGAAAAFAVDQWRQMFGVETRRRGVHDHDALDYVAQFAHVARPGIAHQDFNGVVGNFARAAAVGCG